MADMFNYEPQENRKSSLDDQGDFFLEYHYIRDGAFTVKADRDTPPGMQLFEDYGDNPTKLYLTSHGFVPAKNPGECVDVTAFSLAAHLAQPSPSNKKEEKEVKEKLISRLRLNDYTSLKSPPTLCLRASKAYISRYAGRLIYYHMIVAMETEQARECLTIYGNRDEQPTAHQNDKCFHDGPASEELTSKALRMIGYAADAALAAYETEGLFDEVLLGAATTDNLPLTVSLTDNEVMAVRYRLGKRECFGISLNSCVRRHQSDARNQIKERGSCSCSDSSYCGRTCLVEFG